MKHTQGPWIAEDVTDLIGSRAYWIKFDEFGSIAEVRHGADDDDYGGDEALVANANLIAAAPEMLTLLIAVVREDSGLYIVEPIRELFAKLGIKDEDGEEI